MKIRHQDSAFSPLAIETDKPLCHSPELCRRSLQMEEDKLQGLRRGKFVRAVRAVLFHIKLRRRNREKRIVSDSMRRSSSSFSFRLRKQSHDEFQSRPDLPKSDSTRSASPSILTSSSSSSSARLSFQTSEQRVSVSSGSHQNPKPQKLEKQSSVKTEEQRQRQRSGASIMIGLVLILMSLGVTILWGRVWAIGFNAMWLACIPQKWGFKLAKEELAESDDDDVVVVAERVEESLKEARRRVIMEGLLYRRHHHKT